MNHKTCLALKAASDKEWGQAFMFNYQSGFTEGTVGLGVDLQEWYGLRLDASGRAGKAGADNTPGSVFPLDDGKAAHDFSKTGVTGKMRIAQTQLKAGSLMPKLPILTTEDGRLLPQTFRGYQVESRDFKDVNLIAGKIEQVMDRNSSNGQGLSIAGANDPIKGKASNQFYYGGVDYAVSKQLQVQYYYASLENFYQQHFLGLVHNWQLPVGQERPAVFLQHRRRQEWQRCRARRRLRQLGLLRSGRQCGQGRQPPVERDVHLCLEWALAEPRLPENQRAK